MKIGALNSSLRKPLPATVRKYVEMGIQGMQIQITPEHLIFSDARLREIRSICSDAGLEISAVCGDIAHTHFGVTDEWKDRSELHKRVVDIAVKLGTKVITTHIGVVPADKADPVYPIMLESIGDAAEYSGSCGTVFAIETGPEKAVVLLQFIKDVDSKGLGVNLDPANLRSVPLNCLARILSIPMRKTASIRIPALPRLLTACANRMVHSASFPRRRQLSRKFRWAKVRCRGTAISPHSKRPDTTASSRSNANAARTAKAISGWQSNS